MTFTTDEDVRVRAYHLWEADGRPDGRDLEFWARAQQSLGNGQNPANQPTPGTVQRKTRSPSRSAVRGTADPSERQPAQRRRRRDP